MYIIMEVDRSNVSDFIDTLVQYDATDAKAELASVGLLLKDGLDRLQDVVGGNVSIGSDVWAHQALANDLIDTSAFSSHPANLIDKQSALSLYYQANSDYNENYVSNNVFSNPNFKILQTSTGLYDGNLLVTNSLVSNVYSDGKVEGELNPNVLAPKVKATFDASDPNNYVHNAMNSEWNTTLGPYVKLTTVGTQPLALYEDISNNSMFGGLDILRPNGNNVARYAKFNEITKDGTLSFHDISPQFQPNENNLLVTSRNLNGVNLTQDDIGTFMIKQYLPTINVSLKADDATSLDFLNNPIMNANGVSALAFNTDPSQVLIPSSLSYDEFNSLFSLDVLNIIKTGYSITTTIESSPNSGYAVNVTDPVIANDRQQLIDAIDNSGLKDAPFYMENYVDKNHSIDFTSGAVSIVGSTNSVPSTASSITVDQVAGEILGSGQAGVDGQILIKSNNPLKRVTDVSGSTSMNVSNPVSVWYNGDNTVGTRPVIPTDFEQNSYLSARLQKVAQDSATLQTTDPSHVKLANNNATLSYNVASGPVNNLVSNVSSFSYTPANLDNNQIRLFKIETLRELIAQSDQALDSSWNTTTQMPVGTTGTGGTVNNNFRTSAVMKNLVADNLSYSKFRAVLTAKNRTQISLNNALTSGWTITAPSGTTILQTSSDRAFDLFNNLPNFSDNILTNFTPIYYKYELKTKEISTMLGGLSDYIEVSYSTDPSFNNAIVQRINQQDLTRTAIPGVANSTANPLPTEDCVPVADALWNFKSSSGYNKEVWELIYVTRKSRYDVAFNPSFGPYSNLSVTISNVQQTQKFYALRRKGETSVWSGMSVLSEVEAPTLPDLQRITETIAPFVTGNTLKLEGIMTADDLKPYTGEIQGLNSNGNWVPVSDNKSVDIYYGSDNIFELNGIDDSALTTADVKLNIESYPLTANDVVVNTANFYISFIETPVDKDYSLHVFESTHNNISTSTLLGGTKEVPNSNILTLADGYASVPSSSWISASNLSCPYKLSVTSANNSKVLTVSLKSNSNPIFTITETGNMIFLGTRFISLINGDCWRSARLLGSNLGNSVLNEVFFKAVAAPTGAYRAVSPETNNSLVIPNLSGIRYHHTSSLNTTTLPLGSNLSFRVLADSAKVSIINPVSTNTEELTSLYNNGSLMHQFVSDPLFSAKVTLPKVRGYPCPNVLLQDTQVYTIRRTGTSVSFNVAGASPLSQTLTTNMSYNDVQTVDNLQAGPVTVDLGLSVRFLYSILPAGAITSYPVDIVGDKVTLTISNPNQVLTGPVSVGPNATPITNQKQMTYDSSLNVYGRDSIFTFSGTNFGTTTRSVGLRPKRVKLNTLAFPHDSLEYKISYQSDGMNVYKANNATWSSDVQDDIGNPELYDPLLADINNGINSSKWTLIKTLSVDSLAPNSVEVGFGIGRIHIKQDPLKARKAGIVLFQLHAPRINFETASSHTISGVGPVIPYDYNSLVNDRKIFRQMRYSPSNIYNPFAPVVPVKDINGVDRSSVVSIPSSVRAGVNNIKFEFLKQRSVHDMYISSSAGRIGITVPGVKLLIKARIGLYDSSFNSVTIWDNRPVTSMPVAPSITETSVYVLSRETDGSINLSVAQDPAVIGYPTGLTGYQQAWNTTVQSNFYNADLQLGSLHWNNISSPVAPVYFDIHANGVLAKLYTVHDVYDATAKTNKRRVYKYTAIHNIDHNDFPSHQTRNISFSPSRSYIDVELPPFPFSQINAGSKPNYEDLVKSLPLPTSAPTWIPDTDFNEQLVLSVAYGNKQTANLMGHKLFSVPDNARKVVTMNFADALTFRNQFKVPLTRINWQGVVKSMVVETKLVSLLPSLTDPTLLSSSNSSIGIHSVNLPVNNPV